MSGRAELLDEGAVLARGRDEDRAAGEKGDALTGGCGGDGIPPAGPGVCEASGEDDGVGVEQIGPAPDSAAQCFPGGDDRRARQVIASLCPGHYVFRALGLASDSPVERQQTRTASHRLQVAGASAGARQSGGLRAGNVAEVSGGSVHAEVDTAIDEVSAAHSGPDGHHEKGFQAPSIPVGGLAHGMCVDVVERICGKARSGGEHRLHGSAGPVAYVVRGSEDDSGSWVDDARRRHAHGARHRVAGVHGIPV